MYDKETMKMMEEMKKDDKKPSRNTIEMHYDKNGVGYHPSTRQHFASERKHEFAYPTNPAHYGR